MSMPTILVVEDDNDHLELTLDALTDSYFSHNIVIVRNGQEALDYLFGEKIHRDRCTDDQPELVLLDLRMPVMNGQQVIERMRADPRTFFVSVIMLTTESEHSPTVHAYKGGFNSFLEKPLTTQAFNDALEQASAHWRNSNFSPFTPDL
jgi:two-component system response regulator